MNLFFASVCCTHPTIIILSDINKIVLSYMALYKLLHEMLMFKEPTFSLKKIR